MNVRRDAVRSFLAVLMFLPALLDAQSANFRAQAKYYSAKSAFEGGSYAVAINLIVESKTLLGGTNDLIQYLHVMSAYRAGRFREAQREMTRFFELVERPQTAVRFSRSVDELTDDEVRAVTMLLDHIDREVANDTEGKRVADANRASAAAEYRNAWRAFIATVATERHVADGLGDDYTSLTGRVFLSGEPEAATLEFVETMDIRDLPTFPSWRPGIRYKASGRLNLTQATRARAAKFGDWPLYASSGGQQHRERVDADYPAIAVSFPGAISFDWVEEVWHWQGGVTRDPNRYTKTVANTDSYSSPLIYLPVRDVTAALAAFERFRTALAAYRSNSAR